MLDERKHKEIWEKVKRLESFETYSPFCRVFYRLIFRLIRKSPNRADELGELFSRFLDIETNRHLGILTASEDGAIRMMDLVEVAGKTREEIESFIEELDGAISIEDETLQMAEHLMRAECYFYLGRTGDVIEELKEAIALGCSHPIVFLALGFNTYCYALKRHARKEPGEKHWRIADEEGFVEMCNDAIDAFRCGLTGGNAPFDAQLHWWIGCISEVLGAKAEAIRSFKMARDIDPLGFGRDVAKKIESLAPSSRDAISDEEKVRLAVLPTLTEADVRRASVWLKGVKTVDDLMKRSP